MQGAPEVVLADHRGMVVAQSRQVQPIAGDVPQPQDGSPGDGAALGLDVPPRDRHQRHAEPLASRAQPVHRMIERLGRRGGQPRAEAQDASRHHHVGDERQVALDVGFARRGAPGDDDLDLGRQEHLGTVEPAAQVRHLGVEAALALEPAPAAGEMEQGRDGGEQREADQQRDAGDLAVVRHAVERRDPEIGCREGRRGHYGADRSAGEKKTSGQPRRA